MAHEDEETKNFRRWTRQSSLVPRIVAARIQHWQTCPIAAKPGVTPLIHLLVLLYPVKPAISWRTSAIFLLRRPVPVGDPSRVQDAFAILNTIDHAGLAFVLLHKVMLRGLD